MHVCVFCLEFRFIAPSTDAFSAFNRMEKGFSNFSHYPVKCGKRLAGLRSQTNLMQSSPRRQTRREGMERDEEKEDGAGQSIETTKEDEIEQRR